VEGRGGVPAALAALVAAIAATVYVEGHLSVAPLVEEFPLR
jgi:hypothetical protein